MQIFPDILREKLRATLRPIMGVLLSGMLVAILAACAGGPGAQPQTTQVPPAQTATAPNTVAPVTATTAPTDVPTARPNTPTLAPSASPTTASSVVPTVISSGSRLRITNSGKFPIKNLTVLFPEDQIAYGDVPAGATTDYRPVPKGVYRYAAYRFDLNGETITQPVIDWVGEEPIRGDAFTYTIDFDPSRERIQMIQLIRVEEDQAAPPGGTATQAAPTRANTPGAAVTPGPFANSPNVLGGLLGTVSAPEGWQVRPCEAGGPFICVLKGKGEIGRVEIAMYPIETMTDFQKTLEGAGIPLGSVDYLDPKNEPQLVSALQKFIADYHSTFQNDRTAEYGSKIKYNRLATQQVRVGKLVGMHYGFAGINQDGSAFERWLSYVAFDGDLMYLIVAHYRPDSFGSFASDQDLEQFAPHLAKIVTGLHLPAPILPTNVKSVKALQEVLIFRVVGGLSNPVGQIKPGESVQVTGVSPNGQWWRVDCPPRTGANCWIAADPKMTQPASP